jgi:hypothetical protein
MGIPSAHFVVLLLLLFSLEEKESCYLVHETASTDLPI